MTPPTRWTSVAAAVVLVAVAGCSARGNRAEPGREPAPAPATAVVERGSISRVVVVRATVRAGATAQLTAPVAGSYRIGRDRVARVLPGGRTVDVPLPRHVRIAAALVRDGARVPANYPIADLRVSGFALVAELDEATIFKMYDAPTSARGEITDGPGPFDCPLANRVPLVRGIAAEGGEHATLTCVVPPDLRVFAGMPGVMAVTTGHADDVLLLPVEAVAGSAQRGAVWVLDGQGRRTRRTVELGLTDGAVIEIRSGVREGDVVAVPGPGLLPGDA